MIFISYETGSSKFLADKIVEFLEKKSIKCWIAPRDVLTTYSYDIIDAIHEADFFLILLNKTSMENRNILAETENAHKRRAKNEVLDFIPVLMENIPLSQTMEYYLATDQYIEFFNKPIETFLAELLNKINGLLSKRTKSYDTNGDGILNSSQNIASLSSIINSKGEVTDESVRIANRYYDVDDKIEKRRLKIEGKLLLPYEREVYDKLLEGEENLNVLISSCMFAPGVMEKLEKRPQINKILGLCYNDRACAAANYDYQNENCKFYQLDCEDEDFSDKLEEYMREMDIEKFDVIDITMGFLDWKNPFRVIKRLSKKAKKGCKIYVRDIDDGVVFAYPDPDNLFSEFFGFYSLDTLAGCRTSGRRIFSYLSKIHAKNITIEKSGIDTADMDEEQRERMFHAWTDFIENDFNILLNKDPKNPKLLRIKKWLNDNFSDLEEHFSSDDFLFNSGYFIVTGEL